MRDHCHETNNYIGPACNVCTLNYKPQNFIPVILINCKGYDFNLMIYEIFNQNFSKRKVDVLPITYGKARLFRVGIL